MYSRFSAAVRFALPPKKFDLERLPSYHAFQRGNLRFVLSQKISSSGVIFKGPRFVLGHPDADQIAGEIVTLRQRMQSLACNVFLSDLTLEFDAVGVVLGHGFHPWKARRPRSIPNPRPVHRQGRTPQLRTTLADLLTPLLVANPFSTVRASLFVIEKEYTRAQGNQGAAHCARRPGCQRSRAGDGERGLSTHHRRGRTIAAACGAVVAASADRRIDPA